MRKKLIVANWKMNLNVQQASLLTHELSNKIPAHRDVEVVLCPNFIALQPLSLQINHRQFKLGAQNCYWRDQGAFTGEISATMLTGLTQYVLVGHSDRRHIFNEHDKDIRHKVQAIIRNSMKPILCIGETAAERAENETTQVIHDQLVSGLLNVTSSEVEHISIAYEPVWALGTGHPVSPSDLKDVVKSIRKQIKSLYGTTAAENLRVLYGGSVTADNAADFLAIDGVDGLLVGGASLDATQFAAITTKAHNLTT